jgi:cation:H+ antiporter
MLLDILAILVGLIVLAWGADRFITGAAALASNLGVAPMTIGLTIVGFGTSAPEMLVSGIAAFDGNPGLAIGNAIGSNIANIGLILGTTALVLPLSINSGVLKREYPILVLVTLLSLGLMIDGELGHLDGVILVGVFLFLLAWVFRAARADSSDPMSSEFDAEIPHDIPTPKALFWLVVGLLLLLASSRALVWGSVNIAHELGVSDLIIGLTIVALGTSLPELAASIASALKGEDDIAIGNIIGSNLYNLLAVLSLPALIAPGAFSPEALYRDQPMMQGLTLALLLLSFSRSKQRRIGRMGGLLLLLAFIGYQTLLFFTLAKA